MGRIRTVKPELFKHDGLFDAEQETGLPLRLAFVGLFTQCDREGRFHWRPRVLKTDIMPYDDVDFSRVLDALATRGWVIKYEHGGEVFGAIRKWRKHQVLNNRESKSVIPEPPDDVEIVVETDASATRQPRVPHASATRHGNYNGEGEREREGEEEKKDAVSAETGGEPPRVVDLPAGERETLESQVYRFGKRVLGQGAGGMITKLHKHCDRDWLEVRKVLEVAERKGDAREYVAAILRPEPDPHEAMFRGAR